MLKEIDRKLNITMMLITHEMDMVKSICHEVVIIGSGELVESGSVAEIFVHPKTELAHKFTGAIFDVPVMSKIMRKFNVDVSILSSDLDRISGVRFGMMIAGLFGNENDDESTLEFLRAYNVKVEVLGYVL